WRLARRTRPIASPPSPCLSLPFLLPREARVAARARSVFVAPRGLRSETSSSSSARSPPRLREDFPLRADWLDRTPSTTASQSVAPIPRSPPCELPERDDD